MRIFISYRRADSNAFSRKLYTLLVRRLGDDAVFRDVDDIPPSANFIEHIHGALAQSSLVILVIGPSWTGASDNTGRSRFDNPSDYVRLEVEAALELNIRILPVLVGGASIPSVAFLPESMRRLVTINAYPVRTGHNLKADFRTLVNDICEAFPQRSALQLLQARAVKIGRVSVSVALVTIAVLVAAVDGGRRGRHRGRVSFLVWFILAILSLPPLVYLVNYLYHYPNTNITLDPWYLVFVSLLFLAFTVWTLYFLIVVTSNVILAGYRVWYDRHTSGLIPWWLRTVTAVLAAVLGAAWGTTVCYLVSQRQWLVYASLVGSLSFEVIPLFSEYRRREYRGRGKDLMIGKRLTLPAWAWYALGGASLGCLMGLLAASAAWALLIAVGAELLVAIGTFAVKIVVVLGYLLAAATGYTIHEIRQGHKVRKKRIPPLISN